MKKRCLCMVLCAALLCFGCGKAGDKTDKKDTAAQQEEDASSDDKATDDNYSPIVAEADVDMDNEYPYEIHVNRAANCITIYGADDTGKYTLPVRAMICSTGGEETPTGSFQLGETSRWQMDSNDEFSQYATRIVDEVTFHSAPYYSENNEDLNVEQFNKMGEDISGSSIQLEAADAKWIAKNCPEGTKVEIYDNSKEPGPLGKPEARVLKKDETKDPTDTAKNTKKSEDYVPLTIDGVEDKVITVSETCNWLEGVSAKDNDDQDLTAQIQVYGQVDITTAGDYQLTYVCSNEDNETRAVSCTVQVVESSGAQEQETEEEASASQEETEAAAESTEEIESTPTPTPTPTPTATPTPAPAATKQPEETTTTIIETVIIDNEPPKIEIVAQTRYVTDIDADTLRNRISASDNSGRISGLYITTQPLPQDANSYIVIYEAVDEAGNSVCTSETVIVTHKTYVYIK